eukprot:3011238-Rhodomonas_salina.1
MDDQEPHLTSRKFWTANTVSKAVNEEGFDGWQDEPGAGDPPSKQQIFFRAPATQTLTFNIKRLQRTETLLGIHLQPNSTWLFQHFNCYVQTPDDPMHQVNL